MTLDRVPQLHVRVSGLIPRTYLVLVFLHLQFSLEPVAKIHFHELRVRTEDRLGLHDLVSFVHRVGVGRAASSALLVVLVACFTSNDRLGSLAVCFKFAVQSTLSVNRLMLLDWFKSWNVLRRGLL